MKEKMINRKNELADDQIIIGTGFLGTAIIMADSIVRAIWSAL